MYRSVARVFLRAAKVANPDIIRRLPALEYCAKFELGKYPIMFAIDMFAMFIGVIGVLPARSLDCMSWRPMAHVAKPAT